MEDFRFLEDNCTWIIIIIAFFLLFGNKEGCGCFNFDCLFGNLFSGCNNSTWMWIIIAVLVYMCFFKGSSCGFLRGDIQ